eukprot:TRINITY_DN23105_c0_g1_i1.p1 TRINITY_DN23105_c0_g1~~TRINITY_DN23105_c0_g1_i1.p1  ORF type:complete len:781 (+),score=218.02 TRINITY_DN23105_c0_g1_i1:64-2343(+)
MAAAVGGTAAASHPGIHLGGAQEGAQMIRKLGVAEHCEPLGYDRDLGLAYLDPTGLPPPVQVSLRALYDTPTGLPVIFFCARCTKVSSSLFPKELVIVISNAALYYCEPSGEIKRCIEMSDITELLQTDDYWVGLRVPSSCDLLIKPRSPRDSRDLTDVLVRLHADVMTRKGRDTPLRVRLIKHKERKIKDLLQVRKPKSYRRGPLRMIETRPEAELRRLQEAPRAVRESRPTPAASARGRSSPLLAFPSQRDMLRAGFASGPSSPVLPSQPEPIIVKALRAPGTPASANAAGDGTDCDTEPSPATPKLQLPASDASPSAASPGSAAKLSPPAWRWRSAASDDDGDSGHPHERSTAGTTDACDTSDASSPGARSLTSSPIRVIESLTIDVPSVTLDGSPQRSNAIDASPPRVSTIDASPPRVSTIDASPPRVGSEACSTAPSIAPARLVEVLEERVVKHVDAPVAAMPPPQLAVLSRQPASAPEPDFPPPPANDAQGAAENVRLCALVREARDEAETAAAVAAAAAVGLRRGRPAQVRDSSAAPWVCGRVHSVDRKGVSVQPDGWRRPHYFAAVRASASSQIVYPFGPLPAEEGQQDLARSPPPSVRSPSRTPTSPAEGATSCWVPLHSLPRAPPGTTLGDCRVVIADRQWARQQAVKRRLEWMGVAVECASTAAVTLSRLESLAARQVVVLVSLPACEVSQTVRLIRTQRIGDWPVVVGVGDPTLPVDAYLPSPPPEAPLADLMRHCFPLHGPSVRDL